MFRSFCRNKRREKIYVFIKISNTYSFGKVTRRGEGTKCDYSIYCAEFIYDYQNLILPPIDVN